MGTWALPKTKKDRVKAKAIISLLETIKTLAYPFLGDDHLFDHIDYSIKRIEELISIAEKNHG